MEKLIVRNFGPISEVELELNKYMVFIGDMSTGKSVLGKLVTIFREPLYEFSLSIDGEGKLKRSVNYELKKCLTDLNIDFDYQNSYFQYSNENFEVIVEDKKVKFISKSKLSKYSMFEDRIELESILKRQIRVLKDGMPSIKFQVNNQANYIPAERMLLSMVGDSISGLWANNVNLPKCFKNFAADYEKAKNKKNDSDFSDFGFTYKFENKKDFIVIGNKKINLNVASSGVQSLVPMLVVLEQMLANTKTITVLVEEPELNLFPIRQKLLVEKLIKDVKASKHNLIITTHSPYVLSVLDSLLLANNTFEEKTTERKKIDHVISESKWLSYDELSIYEVQGNGTVRAIKDDEFRSIDSNTIDKASNIISSEFDKLTSIRYGEEL